jgi:hypothetical protein
VFSIEGTTYIYRLIDGFAKVAFVWVFSIERTTYIYRPIDGFAKVEFV